MKTFNTFTQDMKKTVFSFGFWACVVLTFLLCFTSVAYRDYDTGKEYSIIESIFSLDDDFKKMHVEFYWRNIYSGALGEYLTMLLPIITAFTFIPNFCSERNSGLVRYTVYRTGTIRYCVSKFVTAVLCGGLAVLIGNLLFIGASYLLFLKPEDYQHLVEFGEILPSEFTFSWMSFRRNTLGCFLTGAMSTLPAFVLSAFVKNRYIITCVPFMAMYMYSSFLQKLMMNAKDPVEFYLDYFYLFTDSLSNYYNAGDKMFMMVLLNVILLILSFFIFTFAMCQKTDIGQ